ncbi:MAG: tRNA pseudouridine(38-40) synthase TruA [Clostridium sp.]|nr:tRNA pseudouridine(38-40) synthase TruA [Clostridium sp.]MCI7444197.1 tRNA pseudouridine(38-40) synthase TruA [Clostridium sp.]
MNNIKLVIQYDGTRYNGWQKQKENKITTIQGKLEHVLSKMTDEEIQVIGCGRTDAGVHADNFVANFTTNSIKSLEKIKEYLDEYLPEDIIIKEIKLASPRFHARYNVKSKSYVYKINNNENNDVFTRKYAYHVKEKLNIEDMKKASEFLIGTHDFKSFTNLKNKKEKSTVRTINYINISENNGIINIEINGNSFLLNMVRIIIGTLIEVGLGKRNPLEMKDIINAMDREKAGERAPALGLMMKCVEY